MVVMRKPVPQGTEFKSLCCGEMGVLMALEIQKGADFQATRRYGSNQKATDINKTHEIFPPHIAVTLRLNESAKVVGTGRSCSVDSAFGSVPCAVACDSKGVALAAIVKTAHKECPTEYFKAWQKTEPKVGEHIVLSSELDPTKGTRFFAVCWRGSKTFKTTVFTSGNTLDSTLQERHGHKKVLIEGVWATVRTLKTVRRYDALCQMFQAFSKVDIHDHLRQGIIDWETFWITRSWDVRIFTTLLSMCITNGFLAYKWERQRSGLPVMPLLTFFDQIAYKLIFNQHLERPHRVLQISAQNQRVICFDVRFNYKSRYIYIYIYIYCTFIVTKTQSKSLIS